MDHIIERGSWLADREAYRYRCDCGYRWSAGRDAAIAGVVMCPAEAALGNEPSLRYLAESPEPPRGES